MQFLAAIVRLILGRSHVILDEMCEYFLKKMRAVFLREYWNAERLEPQQVAQLKQQQKNETSTTPSLQQGFEWQDNATIPSSASLLPNQYLIKVHYAGVNPIDEKIRKGNLSMYFSNPSKLSYPMGLGHEFSGHIVAKGNTEEKEAFKMNDQVLGYTNGKFDQYGRGAYAEYIIAEKEEIAKKPVSMPMHIAAALPLAALATHQSFQTLKELPKDQPLHVLILGASGNVGTFAVQYAKKELKAKVYAVCSEKNAAYVKETLGADYVIPYQKQGEDYAFELDVPDVDLVIDLVGTKEYRKRCWNLLKPRKGNYVCLAIGNEHLSAWKLLKLGALMTTNRCMNWIGFSPVQFHLISTKPNGEDLEKLAQIHSKHQFVTYFSSIYPFSLTNVIAAHRQIASHHTRGKILLNMDKNSKGIFSQLHQYQDLLSTPPQQS